MGQDLRAHYPQLRGIVIMSPHWMSPFVEVMAHPRLQPGMTLAAFLRRCTSCSTLHQAALLWRRKWQICSAHRALVRAWIPIAPWTMALGCP